MLDSVHVYVEMKLLLLGADFATIKKPMDKEGFRVSSHSHCRGSSR